MEGRFTEQAFLATAVQIALVPIGAWAWGGPNNARAQSLVLKVLQRAGRAVSLSSTVVKISDALRQGDWAVAAREVMKLLTNPQALAEVVASLGLEEVLPEAGVYVASGALKKLLVVPTVAEMVRLIADEVVAALQGGVGVIVTAERLELASVSATPTSTPTAAPSPTPTSTATPRSTVVPTAIPSATKARDARNVEMVGFFSAYSGCKFSIGNSMALHGSGSYVYIQTYDCSQDSHGGTAVAAWLTVLDVSQPSAPTVVNRIDVVDISDMTVVGNYLYLVDLHGFFWVEDVRDPAHPKRMGAYATPASEMWCMSFCPGAVAVAGRYAYAAGSKLSLTWPATVTSSGIWVIDVSNPAKPQPVGWYEAPGNANDVAVSSRYAYVASGEGGLRVVDISNPAQPREVGFYDTPGDAWRVTVAGNYAYVAARGAGLVVVDISNPARPRKVGFYPGIAGNAWDVTVSGQYAYVTAGDSLWVVDVSNPAQPREVGFYPILTPNAWKVVVSGDYIYVAADNSLFILRFTGEVR